MTTSPAQVELSKSGLHWDALNEDISVAGLLAASRTLPGVPRHFLSDS